MTDSSGRYQVWHRDGDDLKHVADVQAANLLAALVLPNLPPAVAGTELVMNLSQTRPTCLGDVIVSPDGKAHQVARNHLGLVFQPIDFTPQQQRELTRQSPDQEMELW